MFKHITARLRVLRSGLRSSEKGVPALVQSDRPLANVSRQAVFLSVLVDACKPICYNWITEVDQWR